MKKYNIIPIRIFYIVFFIVNFLNSFALLRGWFNPNISPYNSFGSILLSSIADISFLVIIFEITILLTKSNKARVIILTIISSILTLLILFLHGFSSMFTTFFSYSQLSSFKNPAQGKLILGYVIYFLSMFKNFCFIFPVLMFICLLIICIFTNKNSISTKNYRLSITGLCSSILLVFIVTLVCNLTIKSTPNEVSMNGVYATSHMGTYNYYVYSIKDIWDNKVDLTDEREKEINKFLDAHIYKSTSEPTSIGNNLIILQLEAINNFVIGLELNGEIIAPNLTNLSTQGYYNNRFYSSAGMGNTSDCEYATLTGLYPNGNDLSVFNAEGENYPTISKEFNKLNYNTFSIHGNEGGFYNRNYLHTHLFGFNEHIDRLKLQNRNQDIELIKDWISDKALLDESINIYKEQTTPFFSYNILVTSHSPYTITDGIASYKNNDLTSLAEDYISYVKYVDTTIGDFISDLKDNGLYDNTTIIIYGDHTSSLLIKDTESITKKSYSSVEYRIEMQNVPFIILDKNIIPQIDNSVHSNIDIYPTIANMFNLSAQYSFGANMLSDERSYVYSPRSLDLIFDDYVIMVPSKKVYYTNQNCKKLSKDEIDNIINDFYNFKYHNDLIVGTNYLGIK